MEKLKETTKSRAFGYGPETIKIGENTKASIYFPTDTRPLARRYVSDNIPTKR